MTVHAEQQWTAGDDWQVNATLLDQDGEPYDLSGTTPPIKWALVNELGETVLTEADANIFIVDAPAGRCSIVIPAAKTAPVPGGRYNDAVRIIFDGITSTLSYGRIDVVGDPYS